MARPREFDQDTVLEKAMNVFWAKGYECTSMQDLVEAMGINRGSLYAAFGDKRALHLAALDRYFENEIAKLLVPLSRPGPIKDALRDVFLTAIGAERGHDGARGCMICNTAVAFNSQDPEVGARVAAGLQRVETAFADAIAAAQTRGEIDAAKNTAVLARYLANGLNGLRVTCAANPERAALGEVVELILAPFA